MIFNKLKTALISIAVMVCIICAGTVSAANLNSFKDYKEDWYSDALNYAVDNNIVKGYDDNTIRSNQTITRAEMASIVNRAFGAFVKAAKFPFVDVDIEEWYADEMKKAVNMGTMVGDGNNLRPDDPITREEAFTVFARAYSMKEKDHSTLEAFRDRTDINEWSEDYLSFLSKNKYINGMEDNKLYPQSNLTRAELVQVLYNTVNSYVSSQNELDSKNEFKGNTIINGVVSSISGKTFEGDLVIGDGVGEETVSITNTKIGGALIIRGAATVRIYNSTVGNRIIVNNPNNTVHFDNYRTEKVFDGVETYTEATWKTVQTGGSSSSRYTVTVYMDGDVYTTARVKRGTLFTPETPIKKGHTFEGVWYTDPSYTTVYDDTVPVKKDLNLYGRFRVNQYKISFVLPDGTVIDKIRDYGDVIPAEEFPVIPEKEGYTRKWSIGDEDYTVEDKDIIVTVIETVNIYKVTFLNYDSSVFAVREAEYGKSVSDPGKPVREGYSFAYWTLDGSPYDLALPVKKDITLIPHWTENSKETYTVTLNYNCTELANQQFEVEKGEIFKKPTDPSREGYVFGGWYKTEECTDGTEYNFGDTVEDNITIYAKWTKAKYTVKFYNYDDTYLGDVTVEYGETAVYSGETPSRAADDVYTYVFSGWDKELTNVKSDMSVKAQFAKSYIEYKISFMADGVLVLEKKAHYNDVIPSDTFPSVPEKTGYTGVWEVNSDITVTGNVIINAVYTAKTYVITFDTDTDEVTVSDRITVVYDSVYPKLPAPVREEYNFVGWFDGDNQIAEGNKVAITGDTVLKAKWTDKEVFTFVFDYNYDGITEKKNIIKGKTAERITPDPQRNGYIFGGWYTTAECNDSDAYDFSMPVNSDITVFAKWTTEKFTVRFFYGTDNDPMFVEKEIEVDYGSLVAKSDAPDAMEYNGYYKNKDISSVYEGEEYNHNVEYLWYTKDDEGNWILYDFDNTKVTGDIDIFNISKKAALFLDSDKNPLENEISFTGVYNDETPLYETLLDVIFENKTLAQRVYDKIDSKDKVINKLAEKGIIDSEMNILNQDRLVKFAIVGNERLKKFVKDTVEDLLTIEPKESITIFLNNLIEKDDGSAQNFLRDSINEQLASSQRDEIISVIADLIKEVMDTNTDEFVSYIDEYITAKAADGKQQEAADLLGPKIRGQITAARAKEFADSMTEEQIGNFIQIYIDSLSESELESEVKKYVKALDDGDIKEEIISYFETLTDEEVEFEIKKYISSLSDDQLKAEIRKYVDSLSDGQVREAIVEYVENLDDESLKNEVSSYIRDMSDADKRAEIKEYIGTLSDEGKKSELTQYINSLTDDEIKSEIINYINTLSNEEVSSKVEDYINDLPEEDQKEKVKEYINSLDSAALKNEADSYVSGMDDSEFTIELENYLRNNMSVVDEIITDRGMTPDDTLREEVINEILSDTVSARENYSEKIIQAVVGDINSYLDKITDSILKNGISSYLPQITDVMLNASNRDDTISSIADKIVNGADKDLYISDLLDRIISGADLNEYIDRNVSYIFDSGREGDYIAKAVNRIVSDASLKNEYIGKTADSIVYGAKKEEYVDKAIEIIADNSTGLKDTYINKVINKIGRDSEYISKAAQSILEGSERDSYIDKAVEMILNGPKKDDYIERAKNRIINTAKTDKTRLYAYIDDLFTDEEKTDKVADFITDKLINDASFRNSNLKKAVDTIISDAASKEQLVNEITDYVINDDAALSKAVDIAVDKIVADSDVKDKVIDKIVIYIEANPDKLKDIVDFAFNSKYGKFIDEFIEELKTQDSFKVNNDSLFIANAIKKTFDALDYETAKAKYIPSGYQKLLPDSIVKPIYDRMMNDFMAQLNSAISEAKAGREAYVSSGFNVEFNPVDELLIPLYEKYKDAEKSRLEDYEYYENNKYLKALVELLNPKNLLATSVKNETHSGYKLKTVSEYYEVFMSASALISDAGKWYIDNVPEEKALKLQDKLTNRICYYFNSITAFAQQYSDTRILPTYRALMEMFKDDIPDRFKDKYKSFLDLTEAKLSPDDKIEDIYEKLKEKGIISKFDTVIDKFIASKYSNELKEENVPALYFVTRSLMGYDNFYTVDKVFDVLNSKLGKYMTDENTFEFHKEHIDVTAERFYE